MNPIEFRGLQAQYKANQQQINQAIENVLTSGDFINGVEVRQLETRLLKEVGTTHCITCANGTDALELVLEAWDIGVGDAVFVPDFTFFATAEVVARRKATPIFVDVCYDTFTMDSKRLEEAIIKVIHEGKLQPKLIIPVDLFGLPADYPAIERIATQYELKVLEDGAQGYGGRLGMKQALSFGDAAITSFFPAKPLGCYGDGGAIFTDSNELAANIQSLKQHGKGKDKYDNVQIGRNSRLDTIQAAILLYKLDIFKAEQSKLFEVYQYYIEQLQESVDVPLIPSGYTSSFAQFTVKIKDSVCRSKLQEELKKAGIPVMVYYKCPLHQQQAFSYLPQQEDAFTVSCKLSKEVLSLPMHAYLSQEQQVYIITNLLKQARQE